MRIRLIITILLIISIIGLLFFFWIRRRIIQKKKERIENLKEDFQEEIDPSPIEEEDEKVLDEIVKKIKNSLDRGENTVKIDIDEKYDIKMATPDILSIETPKTRLHKSFDQLKFEKIEDYDQGKKIYFKD